MIKTASKKVVNAWAMYDWASSVYNLVITSTIFPAYFAAVTGDDNEKTIDIVTIFGRQFVNTSLYNYTLALAFIVVALLSPLLSSIADFKGNKKQFMRFFCTMGSLGCCALFFFDRSNVIFGLVGMLVACIGFWGSWVFYNAYLPEISSIEDRDRISAKGFVMGYIGSVLLQLVCFVLVLKPELFNINGGQASQYSFLLVGIWWCLFGWASMNRLPDNAAENKENDKRSIVGGYKELSKVWEQTKSMPVLKNYLFSYFFYNMGLQTIFLAATLYGSSELQIPTTNLIVAILIIQLIAIPGAWIISKVSDRIGNFKTLAICILVWAFLCIAGYLLPVKDINAFYGLALAVGFFMGGTQSLSRSTYSKLMPETKDTASFFSFYDVTEKIAIVLGMFSFALITEVTGSQRGSVLALIVFFILGLAIMVFQIIRKKVAINQ
jgi:UMF1 family MFS transporter